MSEQFAMQKSRHKVMWHLLHPTALQLCLLQLLIPALITQTRSLLLLYSKQPLLLLLLLLAALLSRHAILTLAAAAAACMTLTESYPHPCCCMYGFSYKSYSHPCCRVLHVPVDLPVSVKAHADELVQLAHHIHGALAEVQRDCDLIFAKVVVMEHLQQQEHWTLAATTTLQTGSSRIK
jgi:hypothetical protein